MNAQWNSAYSKDCVTNTKQEVSNAAKLGRYYGHAVWVADDADAAPRHDGAHRPRWRQASELMQWLKRKGEKAMKWLLVTCHPYVGSVNEGWPEPFARRHRQKDTRCNRLIW